MTVVRTYAVALLAAGAVALTTSAESGADPQDYADPRLENATIFCLSINNNPTDQGVYNAINHLMNRTGGDADLALSTTEYGLANLCPMYRDLFDRAAQNWG